MRVDPLELRKIIEGGDPEHRIKAVTILENKDICRYGAYDHIFLKYETEMPDLYKRKGDDGYGTDPFIKSVRLKLIYEILRAPHHQGGCGLEVSKLLHKKKILAMYPLHDQHDLTAIRDKVLDKWTLPWEVPVLDIKEYFGEKIALYNVFLGHYSQWLIIPSIIGLAFQLVVWGTLDFSHPVLPFYSLVITVWSVFMLEYWKRLESSTAMRWGMSDYEQQEQDRPEYTGEAMKSFVNGRMITYNPPNVSRQVKTVTQIIIACFIAVVIGVVAGIYVFRFYLQRQKNGGGDYASTVASVLNTVQIMVFNAIYQVVATKLTDVENHRTDTAYEDSLIVKLFVFQFINSYASFFFLAFIAGNLARPEEADPDFLGQCGATNCMQPLSINLAIIFGSRLTFTNLLDIAVPWYMHKQKIKKESSGLDEVAKANATPAEQEYYLMQYRPMVEGLQVYADTAVQYGFTLLFITALPCASFFSLVNNYVKVKFTAWKLCGLYQRPIPRGAQDIGTWQTILTIISVASVITNAGLICFTMDVLWGFSLQGRVWIFVGFQWVLIAAQFIAQAIVPDVPQGVIIQRQRTEFYNEKVINKVTDEDYDEVDELEEDSPADQELVNDCRGSLCGIRAKTHHKKIKGDFAPVNPLPYPKVQVGGKWPEPVKNADGGKTAHVHAPPSPSVRNAMDTYVSPHAATVMPPQPPAQGSNLV